MKINPLPPSSLKPPDVLAGGSLLGTGTGAWKSHSGSSLPPPALIRTSCGWDYAVLGEGGRGNRQPGLEKEIRNKWWCGGTKDWQSTHRGLGSAL